MSNATTKTSAETQDGDEIRDLKERVARLEKQAENGQTAHDWIAGGAVLGSGFRSGLVDAPFTETLKKAKAA